MERSSCPNCGKTIDSPEMQFCPFCGTALPAPEPEEELDPVGMVRRRYEAYAEWVESTHSNREFSRVLRAMFTGDRSFKNSLEHAKFLTEIEVMGDTLLEAYRAGEKRETLPELLRYVLIDCHQEVPQETDWMYMATEKVFLPMIELLTKEEADVLYPAYQQLRKKQPGLEIQKNVKKRFKDKVKP